MEFQLTKYEKVRLLGLRATQLSNGAKPATQIGDLRDPLKIAEKEYMEGVIPISVIRTLPDKSKIQVDIVKRHQVEKNSYSSSDSEESEKGESENDESGDSVE